MNHALNTTMNRCRTILSLLSHQWLLISLTMSLSFALFVPLTAAASQPTKCQGSNCSSGSTTVPVPGASDALATCQPRSFFGLIPWYNYITDELYPAKPDPGLVDDDPCGFRCFNVFPQSSANECGQKASDVPLVLLAIIDDLLRIAGLVAIAYVIYGGFKYTTSQGSPDETAKAQGAIINALVGLAIALIAIVLVSFLGSSLGG